MDKIKYSKTDYPIPSFFSITCDDCSKSFGKDVIALGTHIGKVHDK